MLQIRLISRVGGPSSLEGGGGGGMEVAKGGGGLQQQQSVETVTVACPDHLVLADLPVARGLGGSTSLSSSSVTIKTVGRRSRRHLGERVHFCVRCDFPIAIYGRLSPCEHAFCLACARSDSSCYLCDERIQKIQTIKMLEGIFICAAPHCLKSFLKRSDFEAHIHGTHTDLLQTNAEREEGNETDASNIISTPSDPHAKQQSGLPDSSTSHAQSRAGFSLSSNSQPHDREDKSHRLQSREPPPSKPVQQQKAPPFYGRNIHQAIELQQDSPLQLERPYSRFNYHQSFENQGNLQYHRDPDHFLDKQSGILPESSFADYPPPHPHQPSSFPGPANINQGPTPPLSYNHPLFPAEGAQPFYTGNYELIRPELVSEGGTEQGSLLGFPPVLGGIEGLPEGYPRPWSTGLTAVSYEQSLTAGQGIAEGYGNRPDTQGRAPLLPGDYRRIPGGLPLNSQPPDKVGLEPSCGAADHKDGKGVLAPLPLPLPLPPPPLPPPPLSQLKRGKFSGSSGTSRDGQAYGWQNDKLGFGTQD